MLRERASGAYYVSAYYVAKMMAEMIVQMFFPLLFSCIVYFLVGFQVRPGHAPRVTSPCLSSDTWFVLTGAA